MGDGKFSTLLRNVAEARADHDKKCYYNGTASEVHLNPADADRLGVEEGEDLAGLTAVRDTKVPLARLRVYCDAELKEEQTVKDDDWFLLCTGRCYVANEQHYPGTGTVNLTIKKSKETPNG